MKLLNINMRTFLRGGGRFSIDYNNISLKIPRINVWHIKRFKKGINLDAYTKFKFYRLHQAPENKSPTKRELAKSKTPEKPSANSKPHFAIPAPRKAQSR
jgi:hypothetical protein